MKYFIIGLNLLCLFLFLPVLVSAHVTVKPSEVGIGAWQSFSMGVPVEKESSTTSLRLVMPPGLDYIMPNVKPGWKIEVKKGAVGETPGEGAKGTEIIWTGGTIPAGQRDEFAFSAKVPSTAGVLQWKAYQTYADGSVVSWDKAPTKEEVELKDAGPYSETKVIDDLKPAEGVATSKEEHVNQLPLISLALSAAALAFSVLALRKKKN